MTSTALPATVPLRSLAAAAAVVPAFMLAEALRWTWRPAVDLVGGRPLPLSALRALMEAWARLLPPQRGVITSPLCMTVADNDGRTRQLEAEWSRPDRPGQGAILYLHGGAFVFGSPRTHRLLTGRLAADTGMPVLAPAYRLAPEHGFPAAFDDAVATYRYLLESGVPASRIIVAGDSAGGHLATGLVAHACLVGLPLPAGVLLLSPWLDLDCTGARQVDQVHRDPFVSPAAAQRLARLYLGPCDRDDVRLRPLTGAEGPLPPFLIQTGGREALGQDARRLAETLTCAGVLCRLQVWPGQIHVFQLLHRWLPAARAAMRQAADFAVQCADRQESMDVLPCASAGSA